MSGKRKQVVVKGVKRLNKLESEIKHEAKRVKGETPIKGSNSSHVQSNAPIPSGNGFRRVSAPAASGVQMTRTGPRVTGNRFSERGTTFMHRENFGQVIATNSYGVTQYSINPGLSNLFPWLAQETVGFESYVVESMSFEFVPFISSAADGTLVMCVDYDAADNAPSNRQQALNLAEATSGNVWSSNVLHCGRKNVHKMVTERYLRAGALGSNLDVKTYDVGKLYIITEGAEVGKLIGDLYVDYRIRLRTTQFNTGSMASINAQSTFDIFQSGTFTVTNAAGTNFPIFLTTGATAPYTRAGVVVSGNVSVVTSLNVSATYGGFISGTVLFNSVPYSKAQAGRYTFGYDAAGRIYLPIGHWIVRQTSYIASQGTATTPSGAVLTAPTVSGCTLTNFVSNNIASGVSNSVMSVRQDTIDATAIGAFFIPLFNSATWAIGGAVDFQYTMSIKPYGGDTVVPLSFKLEDGQLWTRDSNEIDRSSRTAKLRTANEEYKEYVPPTPDYPMAGSSSSATPSSYSVRPDNFVNSIETRGLNSFSGQTGVIPAGPSFQPSLRRV